MTAHSSCDDCPAQGLSTLRPLGEALEKTDYTIALAGNPNTGKSTVFNRLTGLRQHTGNWPGKTVARAEGGFLYRKKRYRIVDLPGTYSLLSSSTDEEIARDFILFARPDVTVIVLDAGALERHLNLALQVLEITDRAVVCLNLVDEAERRGIKVDGEALAGELGVPVVMTSALRGRGIDRLLETIAGVSGGTIACRPRRARNLPSATEGVVSEAEGLVKEIAPELANSRWIALRLLEADPAIMKAVEDGRIATLHGADHAGTAAGAIGPAASRDESAAVQVRKRVEALRWRIEGGLHDILTESLYAEAARLVRVAVKSGGDPSKERFDRALDRLLTSPWTGFPVMVLLLALVFWLTIQGANVPSEMIATLLLGKIHPWLKIAAATIGLPAWLDGLLIDGMYMATAWVISVMLPPMAIFFPLFTIAEDLGYLPRVAFNLDRIFKSAGAHGKQALTMSMGFGCNAAGVIATRIIDSPRERLIAIVTNNFALCNGRWPTQILLATVFIGSAAPPWLAGVVSASAVVSVALLGILFSFATSWLLSRTALRGEPSTFALELPPWRKPRIGQILYTSLIDRTLFVLWRAVVFAMPAGAAIWLVANVSIGEMTLAEHAIRLLDPLGLLVGLNGVILLAYVVAIPANEIVVPTILMLTVLNAKLAGAGAGAGVMFELDSLEATRRIFEAGGWTTLTAVNLMLFSLLHNPCSTTIYTIYKETGSARWAAVSTLLPVIMGFAVCFLTAAAWRLL